MKLTFEKVSAFDRGILYALLADAYSFDMRWKARYERDWIAFDDFFFDHLEIADKYGFITALGGQAIGHISWDPRNRPDYVILGHNCIASQFKGNGYGKRQLQEAIRRIRKQGDVKKIIVQTYENLVAPHNYESAGFKLCKRTENTTDTAFSGDILDYELLL